MLVGMNKILESGEHNQERYKGSTLEVFVKQLNYLSATSNATQTGMPKANNFNAYGPPTKHRLGSKKSWVTGNKKMPRTCTFCGEIAGEIFHSN